MLLLTLVIKKLGKDIESMSLHYKTKCAWCGSELVKSEQEALKKESQHICFSCCQSDDENYGTQQHLKEYVCSK